MIFLSTPSARRATTHWWASGQKFGYFYPRPLRGGRRGEQKVDLELAEFLSTPSARRATGIKPGQPPHQQDFYPRPLRGGRPKKPQAGNEHRNFYPRPLRGGRRKNTGLAVGLFTFLSTPSARRATLSSLFNVSFPIISIHALCEEGDVVLSNCFQYIKISIHALCEEGDSPMPELAKWVLIFLSTPSARRATSQSSTNRKALSKFLSTPSARRATRPASGNRLLLRDFYPRPLRGGRPAFRVS